MANFMKRGKTWQYRVSYMDGQNQRQYVNKSGFATKRAAQEAAAEVERQYRRGADLGERSVTLLEYWDRWIKLYKSGKHATVTEKRYGIIRRQLARHFGEDQQLKTITKSDWQEFLNAYAAGEGRRNGLPRSKDSASKLNGYVRAMANAAVDDQIIFANFTSGAILSGEKGKASELKYLQTADFKKLLSHAVAHASLDKVYNYIIATAVLTGARFSEVIGLDWPNVDLDKAVLHIRHTWDYNYHTGFAPTKNESSVRDVDIPQELVTLLRQLKKEQQEYRLRAGYRDPYDLVFRNSQKEIPSNSAINKDLRMIEKKLAISPLITFHGLRHTHVSYLLSQGVDISYISHRIGHANIGITMTVYSHLLKDAERSQIKHTLEALSIL
ncbi:site-specific integrase [Schleiferilactobacillus shenzhenensis]|uniref:Tyr recombinase domain-containing protein n=1 Tax=Schleiferilactobacillus shenzhenensis LY-73 TaxID=1231336 RepID=U4TIJ2_9LACO|nr:site-specific integrase [Schleiferilactobacillus shenzhenensis]ERL63999.1 hypothetical protein L248_1646 [Schleiferilactobacillus shenzhenensis LY-73]